MQEPHFGDDKLRVEEAVTPLVVEHAVEFAEYLDGGYLLHIAARVAGALLFQVCAGVLGFPRAAVVFGQCLRQGCLARAFRAYDSYLYHAAQVGLCCPAAAWVPFRRPCPRACGAAESRYKNNDKSGNGQ